MVGSCVGLADGLRDGNGVGGAEVEVAGLAKGECVGLNLTSSTAPPSSKAVGREYTALGEVHTVEQGGAFAFNVERTAGELGEALIVVVEPFHIGGRVPGPSTTLRHRHRNRGALRWVAENL